jgi:hypothetical protein
MGSQQGVREWSGINTFAPATQTKLLELLGKHKQEVLFFISLFQLLHSLEQFFMFWLCSRV